MHDLEWLPFQYTALHLCYGSPVPLFLRDMGVVGLGLPDIPRENHGAGYLAPFTAFAMPKAPFPYPSPPTSLRVAKLYILGDTLGLPYSESNFNVKEYI